MPMYQGDSPLPARFWAKVDKAGPGGCWVWTAGVNASGYGRLWLDGGQMAHRLAYVEQFGPIEPGLVIDHLCRNVRCVNPDHMEPVTIRTNVLRGSSPPATRARSTTCKRGHEYTPENTSVRDGGNRRCKECQRADVRAYKKRRAQSSG